MSNLELNKIVASILLASLIAMVVGFIANILYQPILQIAERGYHVHTSENTSDNAIKIEEVPIDIESLMANANAKSGARVIKKCISCHSLDEDGANKVGPNLWRIINAEKGKKDGFRYSKALLATGGSWDEESLFHFLKKPSKYIPGTKMTFIGLKKPEDIANVIAYLKEEKS